jgi:hypothetical protein
MALECPSKIRARRVSIYVTKICGLLNFSAVKTYSNSCFATRENAIILHSGPCYGEARCPRNTLFSVCAKSPTTGIEWTYDNLCWAEKNLGGIRT